MKTLYVYTTNNCALCEQAKTFLNNLGIPYQEMNADHTTWMHNWLRQEGHTKFPVFYADEHVFMKGDWRIVGTMTKQEILERL